MSSQPPDVYPIIALAVLLALGYALTRLSFGSARACRRCHGTGVIPAIRVGTLRPCPRCQATGRRTTTGTRTRVGARR